MNTVPIFITASHRTNKTKQSVLFYELTADLFLSEDVLEAYSPRLSLSGATLGFSTFGLISPAFIRAIFVIVGPKSS